MVKTIETSDKDKFEQQVNELLNQNFKLSSSSCGFVNSKEYDFCPLYQAILIKC